MQNLGIFSLSTKKPTRDEGTLTDVSISIVGHWNRMIFTPRWVADKLFQSEGEVEASVPFMPFDPISYKDNHVKIEVSSSQLTLNPVQIKSLCLELVEKMAVNVLLKLPDTPIRFVAINFDFSPILLKGQFSTLFDGPDKSAFKYVKWNSQADRILRHFRRGKEGLVVAMSRDTGTTKASFFFHFETTDCRIAAKTLQSRVATNLQESQEILRRIYQVNTGPII